MIKTKTSLGNFFFQVSIGDHNDTDIETWFVKVCLPLKFYIDANTEIKSHPNIHLSLFRVYT